MTQFKETINIDLTQEDTEIVESQNHEKQFVNFSSPVANGSQNKQNISTRIPKIIPPKQDLMKMNHVSVNSKSHEVESSTTNLIKTLQRENPQIETVFIESDDEERGSKASVANKTSHCLSSSLVSAVAGDKRSGALPFTVKTLSPCNLDPHLIRNSNTIALHDGNKNSPRKYLVIPQEIAPLLAKSKGPVSINIPGIGPLVIPKPSDIFNQQSPPIFLNASKQASNQNNLPIKKTIKETPYHPLSDTKYCWRIRKHRKLDLEGFTFTDRLGFYQAEQMRGKYCSVKLTEYLSKLQDTINKKTKALEKIRSPRLSMDHVKLVEIDSIKKADKGIIKIKKPQTEQVTISPEPLIDSETDSADESLLVTRKVVIINDNEAEPQEKKKRGRKRKLHSHGLQNLKGQYKKESLNSRKKVHSDIRKKKRHSKKMNLSSSLHKIKPCYVELSENKVVKDALKRYNDSETNQKHRLGDIQIDNLKKFQDIIEPKKPFLIINEEHIGKFNFSELHCKYNVIFPTTERTNLRKYINNTLLVMSAKAGYIKFVDNYILCKYLSGRREK